MNPEGFDRSKLLPGPFSWISIDLVREQRSVMYVAAGDYRSPVITVLQPFISYRESVNIKTVGVQDVRKLVNSFKINSFREAKIATNLK